MAVGAAVLTMFLEPWGLFGPFESRESRALDDKRGAKRDAREPAGAGATPRSPAAPSNVPPLAEIFRDHAPLVWRGLRRLGVPESDVEDVCQRAPRPR